LPHSARIASGEPSQEADNAALRDMPCGHNKAAGDVAHEASAGN